MTAPFVWPEGAREAVAPFVHAKWMQSACLAALAPFVAQIKAAAFKRGAEAMREANAAVVDAHAAAAKRCSEEGDVIYRIRAEFLANSYAIQSAADDVRVTPIPEDKP